MRALRYRTYEEMVKYTPVKITADLLNAFGILVRYPRCLWHQDYGFSKRQELYSAYAKQMVTGALRETLCDE